MFYIIVYKYNSGRHVQKVSNAGIIVRLREVFSSPTVGGKQCGKVITEMPQEIGIKITSKIIVKIIIEAEHISWVDPPDHGACTVYITYGWSTTENFNCRQTGTWARTLQNTSNALLRAALISATEVHPLRPPNANWKRQIHAR